MRTAASGRALGRARLQQVEPAALDRELDVLDVAVLALEQARGLEQARRGARAARSRSAASGSGSWVPLTTSSPWPPRQPLAVGLGVAAERVAAEEDAGARALAEVAEDHRLHDHGGAAVLGDAPVAAVGPARREDQEPNTARIAARSCSCGSVGHLLAGVVGDGVADCVGRSRPRPGSSRSAPSTVCAELVDEAQWVERAKAGSPESAASAVLDLVGDAEVQDRVHHPRHAHRGARAHGDEQRGLGVAEAAAGWPARARRSPRARPPSTSSSSRPPAAW